MLVILFVCFMKEEHQQFIHPLYGRLCGHLLPQFKPRFKDWRTISRLPETWLVNQHYIPLGSSLIFKFRHLEATTKEGTVINTGVQLNYVWEINHFKRTENKLSDQYWINVSTECSCLEKKLDVLRWSFFKTDTSSRCENSLK